MSRGVQVKMGLRAKSTKCRLLSILPQVANGNILAFRALPLSDSSQHTIQISRLYCSYFTKCRLNRMRTAVPFHSILEYTHVQPKPRKSSEDSCYKTSEAYLQDEFLSCAILNSIICSCLPAC